MSNVKNVYVKALKAIKKENWRNLPLKKIMKKTWIQKLNEKYPGGLEAHKKLLQKKGFKVIARGKKYQAVDFNKYLIDI